MKYLKVMRNIITLLVLFIISNSASFRQNCSADSTFYNQISPEVDTLVLNGAHYLFNSDFLTKLLDHHSRDNECLILNYALVFDAFVKKGVILNGRLPKPLPRNNRLSADSLRNEEFKKLYKDDSVRFAHNTFFLFTNIKQEYEIKFIFHNNMQPNFESMIDDVLKYCPLSNPKIVKDMLLGKYKHVNRDKFFKDMRYYDKKE